MQLEMPLKPQPLPVNARAEPRCSIYGWAYIWKLPTLVHCPECESGKEVFITAHRWDCHNCSAYGLYSSSFFFHDHE